MPDLMERDTPLSEAAARTPAAIQTDLIERFVLDPSLEASGIGVSARADGVVALSGRVPTLIEKRRARQIARRTPGVRAVVDELKVELDPAARRDDVDLAEAAVRSLEWHVSVPDDRIDVIVEDGTVALEGTVDWPFQRAAAENAVHGLAGVREVRNRIIVLQRVEPGALQREVELALSRSTPLLAGRIKVEVFDHSVILKGSVRDWWDLEAAEQLARSVGGVTEVDNRLEVEAAAVVAFDDTPAADIQDRIEPLDSQEPRPAGRSAPRDVLLFCADLAGRSACAMTPFGGARAALGLARADCRLRIDDEQRLIVVRPDGTGVHLDQALASGLLTIVAGFEFEVLKNLFQMTMHNEIRSDLIFELMRASADPLAWDLETSDERITLLDADGNVCAAIDDPFWWRIHDPDRAGEIAERLIDQAPLSGAGSTP